MTPHAIDPATQSGLSANFTRRHHVPGIKSSEATEHREAEVPISSSEELLAAMAFALEAGWAHVLHAILRDYYPILSNGDKEVQSARFLELRAKAEPLLRKARTENIGATIDWQHPSTQLAVKMHVISPDGVMTRRLPACEAPTLFPFSNSECLCGGFASERTAPYARRTEDNARTHLAAGTPDLELLRRFGSEDAFKLVVIEGLGIETDLVGGFVREHVPGDEASLLVRIKEHHDLVLPDSIDDTRRHGAPVGSIRVAAFDAACSDAAIALRHDGHRPRQSQAFSGSESYTNPV